MPGNEKEERVYRKISREELDEILSEHVEWLRTKKAQGRRAWLEDADLKGADIRGANLKGAYLVGADLKGANLVRADLKGAYLVGADLKGANLWQANLSDANVTSIKYDKQSGANPRYAGIRVATCYGSPFFKRDVEDLDWLSEYLATVQRSKKSYLETFKKAKVHYQRIPKGKIVTVSKLEAVCLFFRIVIGCLWARVTGEKVEEGQVVKQADTVKTLVLDLLRVAWAEVWRFTSDYGRNIGRWVGVSIYIAFLFGFIYAAMPYSFEVPHLPDPYNLAGYETGLGLFWGSIKGLGTMIYYSVVTFTTLGFGDVVPKNLFAAGVVMTEVIIGYIMLGGLISIFANILARRS